jgi:REP element-mobilizing transposase RayT
MKVRDGSPSLRAERTWRVVRAGLDAAKERFGARVVHFSVQRDHLHLIVEAADVRALMRAMRALAIRLAMRLNRWWRRRGRVFADRYHARVLRTPREVRHVLAYVLLNGRRHGVARVGIDPCSSGAWFDGWAGLSVRPPAATAVVAAARTWLLRLGWRRHGPIRFGEVPGRR